MSKKQKILVIIIALALIIGVISFKKFFFNENSGIFANTTFERESEKIVNDIIIQKDSDGDGLYDWEEALWGSDPNNPDTDNDGTSDNDEVLSGRNPIIPYPDDFLATEEKNNSAFAAKNDTGLTLTQSFSRDFINTYLSLKKNDNFTEENQEKLINVFLGETLSRESLVAPLSLSDIIILSKDADVFASVSYIQSIEKAIENSFTYSYFGNEILVLKDILEKKDSRDISLFKEAEDAYAGFAKTLLKIKSPAEIANTHLSLINSARIIAKNFKDIKNLSADPLNALIGVKTYTEESKNFSALLNDIGRFGISVEKELRQKISEQ